VCEKVLLASTLLYDIPEGKWWDEMLEFVGLSENELPFIMNSAEKVGNLSTKAAADTGLSINTVAVTGALDQVAAMVGSGNISPGRVTEVTGSCLVVETVTDRFPEYEQANPITCQPFSLPDRYLLLMYSNTAGMAFKWFRDGFFPGGDIDYAQLAAEAEEVNPGADGLIMLPHLAGAQFPRFDPDAKGVFWGATLAHSRGHFVRAILESVAYLERSMIDTLEKSGYEVHDITTLGGGAKNMMWNDIKANVVNQSISTTQITEPASLGAAILGGVGSGVFKSLEEGCAVFSKPGDCVSPEKETAKLYDSKYSEFIRLNNVFQEIGKTNPK
jgi:xylulokinase